MNASRKFFGLLGLITVLVLITTLMLPTNVYAQGTQPPSDPSTRPPRDGSHLEKVYARLQEFSSKQAERLANSDEFIARIEARIAKLKEHGVDTSEVEAALTNFTAQLPIAQAAHDSAAATLATHAGFDDNGKVTDPATARETVRSAATDLNTCRQTLKDAAQAIFDAFKNLPRPQPQKP
jgi:hypothetical protein